jgi:adenosylcobinamide-GDP ribazoletransferase
MSERDTDDGLVQAGDLWLALGLLTRLPLPVQGRMTRGARAAWAWPLAGAVVGAIGGAVAVVSLNAGLPAMVAAGLAIAITVMITGAMHEDGLADTVDGFWGGWDRARRLEIMRDSHIGTYGVLALIVTVGVKWALLMSLLDMGMAWPAMIAAAALGRGGMVGLMTAMPFARDDGLARSVGRPTMAIALLAGGLALCCAILTTGLAGFAAALAAGAITVVIGWSAHHKIGGQTGDVLGAGQQLAEIAALTALVLVLS